ncbi:MAG TPA: RNA pseudouridine synthase, partial [Desulfovibrio sp.]|nr:RNA pseudouridine synthase [Desulfovibrio sp.]
PEDHGARLDAALARLLPLFPQLSRSGGLPPGAGLRARRRLWLTHAVLLDGRPAPPGARVRAGQRVELRPLDVDRDGRQDGRQDGHKGGPPYGEPDGAPHALPDGSPHGLRGPAHGVPPGDAENSAPSPRVLAEADGLVALSKPGGLHSAAIAGSPAPSVEARLPALLGEGVGHEGFPRLLNRLDGPTSGILLAARTPQAAQRFHAAEDSGQMAKTYLALVHGTLEQPVTMRRALDTANRATTRVLQDDTPDPLRHTKVTPLGAMSAAWPDGTDAPPVDTQPPDENATGASLPNTPCTLVRCVIRKGARHQIRAHLAALGHPIVGDVRYGGGADAEGNLPEAPSPAARQAGLHAAPTLFLHHARTELPGFRAACPPPWLYVLPPELQEAARAAYRLDS